MNYHVRRAEPSDAPILTELAFQSKRYWGYPESWIQAWSDQLTVTPEMIQQWVCYVAELNHEIKGFWCREPVQSDQPSQGLLFVEPDAIGTGCGRQLWGAVKQALHERGIDYFVMEADPNAAPFYMRLGAKQIGEKSSSIVPGRFLPVLRFDLK